MIKVLGENYYFDLIDILLVNCENGLFRIQKELTKKQESLNKRKEIENCFFV